MVDDTESTPPSRRGNRRRLVVILTCVGVVIALAAGGVVAYGAASEATAAAELAAAEDAARDAAIQDAVLARTDAYEFATAARAFAGAAGDLLSEDERTRLLATIKVLDAHVGTALPAGRDADEVVSFTQRFSSLVDAVHEALRIARDATIETATDRLNAAALASPEPRDAVTDAIEALKDAEPSAELVAALLRAVEAAEKSAQDAVAAAADTPAGGSGGAGSGGSGGSGGTGGAGGTTPPPGGTVAPPPPPPPYTDADARAAVVNAYALPPMAGTCLVLNSGTWGRSSVPPPPRYDLLPAGGWMAYSAWSTGGGGAVKYYGCK